MHGLSATLQGKFTYENGLEVVSEFKDDAMINRVSAGSNEPFLFNLDGLVNAGIDTSTELQQVGVVLRMCTPLSCCLLNRRFLVRYLFFCPSLVSLCILCY